MRQESTEAEQTIYESLRQQAKAWEEQAWRIKAYDRLFTEISPVIPLFLTSSDPKERMKEITDRLEKGIAELFMCFTLPKVLIQ